MTERFPLEHFAAITCVSGTDVGLRREENQDSFGFIESEEFKFYFVADGMGGAQGGAEASQLAVASVRGYLAGELYLTVDSVLEATAAANTVIYKRGTSDSELTGMGTTFVGVGFCEKGLLVCNVGDSRAYRLRDGKIGQMTTDHTFIQDLVNSGTLTEAQAIGHPMSHMLTRSLGPADAIGVDCWMYDQMPHYGDVYILCSDGLYNLVSPIEMAEAALFSEGQEAVSKLIALANEGGGSDNITVLIIRIGEPKQVPVRELEIERIPRTPPPPPVAPPAQEVTEEAPLSASQSSPNGPPSHDELDSPPVRESFSGAFKQSEWWKMRTALKESSTVIVLGTAGLLVLMLGWAFSFGGLAGESGSDGLQLSTVPAWEFHPPKSGDMVDSTPVERIDKDLATVEAILVGLPAEGSADFSTLVSKQVENARSLAVAERARLEQALIALQGAVTAQIALSASVSDIVPVTKQLEDIPEVATARDAHSKILWTLRQGVDPGATYDPVALEISKKESEAHLQHIARVSLDKRIADLSASVSERAAELLQAEYLGRLISALVPKDGVISSTAGAERNLIRQQRESLHSKNTAEAKGH